MKTRVKPKLDTDAVQLNYCRMQSERSQESPMAEVFEARMNRALDEYLDAIHVLGAAASAAAKAIEHLDFTTLSPETEQIIAEYED